MEQCWCWWAREDGGGGEVESESSKEGGCGDGCVVLAVLFV